MATHLRPGPGHAKIGEGLHSEVFRRPGSPWVIQLFKVDCDGLTLDKIRREYAYLVKVFAAMPRLIPYQRLFAPGTDPSLSRAVLVKRYVDVDPGARLTTVAPALLPARTRRQIAEFLRIVRQLLIDTAPDIELRTDASLIPDIIDPPLDNLVVDTDGDLRLVDTNRLISTAALRRLHHAGQTINLDHHTIHALVFRRLMFLESRYLGRTRDELTRDPVYTRYLTPSDMLTLAAASAAVGEHLEPVTRADPGPSRPGTCCHQPVPALTDGDLR